LEALAFTPLGGSHRGGNGGWNGGFYGTPYYHVPPVVYGRGIGIVLAGIGININ
jgi:hypothetical protein